MNLKKRIINKICRLGFLNFMPDESYLKLRFKTEMGYPLDLKSPKTFNEKLQWLKLYDRNPEYTKLVDKYGVRKYIADKIGDEYLIPLLGVWDNFDDIDFDKLPEQFVLKCTHDSGGIVICTDKLKFDKALARKKINKSLKRNFFYLTREWPYKNVKPKILAECYMEDKICGELIDYKFFCFKGNVPTVMVCIGRKYGDTKFYFFDSIWNLMRINKRGIQEKPDFSLPKPHNIEKMFELAKVLSSDFPFVRIDLYNCNRKIYFGEITFFPDSGFDNNLIAETDKWFGSMINLEELK